MVCSESPSHGKLPTSVVRVLVDWTRWRVIPSEWLMMADMQPPATLAVHERGNKGHPYSIGIITADK